MKEEPRISLKAIKAYLRNDYELILLRRYDAKSADGRELGKAPIESNWTKITAATEEEITAHAKAGNNIGVRLRKTDLVIDADPRNYAPDDDPLERLAADLGFDLNRMVTVETGGGGRHIYFTKPKDTQVQEKIEDYKGLEFKSVGRQVVAAGSIHPSGKKYSLDPLSEPLDKVPPAPKALLELLVKDNTGHKKQPEKRGVLTSDQLQELLSVVDAEDFREPDEWLTFMMACHQATACKGREVFTAWSVSDPEYAGREAEIRTRWDSLKAEGNDSGQITYRTLFKIMRDMGHGDRVAAVSAAADFAGIEGMQEDVVSEMNARFCVVNENAKFRVYEESLDVEFDPPRKRWLRYGHNDFHLLHQHKVTTDKEGKVTPVSKLWLASPRRLQYDGIVFDPKMSSEHKNYLNLWRGWAVPPKAGAWKYLQELICDVFCNGEEELSKYVLDWAAYMVQYPERPAEVALCFMGEKGTGKSTFGRALVALAGRHGWHIASSQQLTGRFNAHLRDCICMFADEAVAPDDETANSRLKALITEPMLTIEGKGQDLVTARNMLHIIMCSNNEWVAPMSLTDERRYFVSQVNNNRQGDKAFFSKLHAELENGGLAAMLHDLLRRDLSDWHPRNNIPVTRAAIEQKINSMSPVARWWLNALISGDFPAICEGEWSGGDVKAFKQDVLNAFKFWARENAKDNGVSLRLNQDQFSTELEKICGGAFMRQKKVNVPESRGDIPAHGDRRTWGYLFPALAVCRAHMDKLLGGKYPWSSP